MPHSSAFLITKKHIKLANIVAHVNVAKICKNYSQDLHMEFLDAIPLFWQDLSRLRVSKDCFAPFLSQQGQTHKISQTEDIGK